MASHRNLGALAALGALFALPLSNGTMADGLPYGAGLRSSVDRGVWISGFDYHKDSHYFFSGITVALNGDMDRDGVAVRVMGARGDFDQDPGSGHSWQGDVMLGYLFNRRHFDGGIFFGLDYQDVTLKPDDPTAEVRGSQFGLKVAGYVESDRELPTYFNFYGEYSTAFDSYTLRARAGLTHRRAAFGPEYILYSDEDTRTQRFGGFLTFDVPMPRPVEVTLSAGYQYSDDSSSGTPGTGRGGGDGSYAAIMAVVPF